MPGSELKAHFTRTQTLDDCVSKPQGRRTYVSKTNQCAHIHIYGKPNKLFSFLLGGQLSCTQHFICLILKIRPPRQVKYNCLLDTWPPYFHNKQPISDCITQAEKMCKQKWNVNAVHQHCSIFVHQHCLTFKRKLAFGDPLNWLNSAQPPAKGRRSTCFHPLRVHVLF